MKRLGFIIFAMLLLPSIAKAEYLSGIEAEEIIIKGKIISQHWTGSTHRVRVIYRGQLWGCNSEPYLNSSGERYLLLGCFSPK